MQERIFSLSLTKVFAALCGTVSVALVAYNSFYGSPTNDHVAFVGMPFLAMAVVLRVRSYVCDLSRLHHETQGLLQDAYNAGREVGREEGYGGDVRRLR